jgi:hypothetical protein
VANGTDVGGEDVEYEGAFGEGFTGPWGVDLVKVGMEGTRERTP